MKSAFILLITVLAFRAAAGFGLEQDAAAEARGLRLHCKGASPGYTLFAPLISDTTYLIDLDGNVVRTWKSAFLPSAWVFLSDNGHLFRGGNDPGSSGFVGGGLGGRFQEFDFDGNLVWDFTFNKDRLPHHDVALLPNGNLLAIVWETKTADQARRAGRREAFIHPKGIWPDALIEFEPQRPSGARIVWEWHIWDHLVQNVDPARDNYGDPALDPSRIDLNADTAEMRVPPANLSRDVFHTNAVAYNPDLDQVILSVPNFNEVWVIDHSTTTEEAAGTTGGRSGKGGGLLYRWGNPQAYGRGSRADRLLGFQHDARWIPPGLPGAGNLMVFSNRSPATNGASSKVYEFAPPVDAGGRYTIHESEAFGPATAIWTYSIPDSFPSSFLSGAMRLENGNMLISSGPPGKLFEVTPAGTIVWEYWSPYARTSVSGDGGSGSGWFSIFRAIRIRPDHPALHERDLRPMDPQPPAHAPNFTTSRDCPN
jgi:hypothetical protein